MDIEQTKFVGLTMELEEKTKEYELLCEKLEKLKTKNIDPNDERLYAIKELFQKNHDEIVRINEELDKLLKF